MAECYLALKLISAESNWMVPKLITNYYHRWVDVEGHIPPEDTLDSFAREAFKHLLYSVCEEFRNVNAMEPVMIMPHQATVLRIVLDDYRRQREADPLFPERVFGNPDKSVIVASYDYWALALEQNLLDRETYFLTGPEHQDFLQELTKHYDSGYKK